MKLPFRQGLVSYQTDGFGNPQFLLPSTLLGFVNFNVAPTPCVVTFAHGASDYLQVFDRDVENAWGPIPSAMTSYLYWDIDLMTAEVTYGLTTITPTAGPTPPSSPASPTATATQHWFDTTTNMMKIWTGSDWRTVVRAFAGRVNASVSNIVSEPSRESWLGVLPVPGNAGYIATDSFGNPLRMPNGEFVTTTSPVRFKDTVGTSGVLAVLPNAYIPVRANQNIPAMTLVYFSGENAVSPASGNPAINPPRIPIGVVQDELSFNEVGVVTQSGEISYDQWDWSDHIGKPLYCGDNGEITTVRPQGLLAYRVGFVKGRRTIVFQVDAETQVQVLQANPNDIIVSGVSPIVTSFATSPSNERVWSVSIPPATSSVPGHMTAAQATLLGSLDVRLTSAESAILGKAPLVHSHAIADVTGLQAALDGKAALTHNHDGVYALVGHNHDAQYAPLSHLHNITHVTGLQEALNDKAPLTHTHLAADITDLADFVADAISGKMDIVSGAVAGNFAIFDASGQVQDSGFDASMFAFANHTHAISNVTGLQAALDNKADVNHTHALDDLSDVNAAEPVIGQALVWNGTEWVPGTVSAGATTLDSLADVNTPFANNGDVLTYSTGAWVAQQPAKVIKAAPFTGNQITGTGSYNFGSALHHNFHVRSTATGDVTIVIQPDSFWTGTQQYYENNYTPTTPGPMPDGGSILIGKHGVGNVIIQAGSGVTINTPDTLVISRTHGKAMLVKVAPNVWDLEGNIGA